MASEYQSTTTNAPQNTSPIAREIDSVPTQSISIGNVSGTVVNVGGKENNVVTYITQGITNEKFDRAQSDTWNDKGREKIREFGVGGGFRNSQAWWLLGQGMEYYLDAIKRDPTNQHPWINLAYVYHVIGKRQKALECINKALELATPGPNYPGNHYKRVKTSIDTNSYDSGGKVVPQNIPEWFQDKWGQYL
ncbi:MAG: tetratricopeptide repeat protein [Anaerolineae bacterium]|nr:tetratricopeptide repeat protein [Anaerolineae bacterium]